MEWHSHTACRGIRGKQYLIGEEVEHNRISEGHPQIPIHRTFFPHFSHSIHSGVEALPPDLEEDFMVVYVLKQVWVRNLNSKKERKRLYMGRGRRNSFSVEEVARIKMLLANTDISISDIATRMGCAKSSILVINRKFQIRLYQGKRTQWTFLNASTVSPQ